MTDHHAVAGCRHAARGADFTLPGAHPHYPPDLEIEPVHAEIDLAVDVDRRAVEGTVTQTVIGRRDGPRTLVLHAVAFSDLEVTSPDGSAFSASYDGREVRVVWAKPFAREERRRIAVRYRVTDPATGLFFGGPTEDRPDAPRWAGTDHETERARHWLPCVDLPSVRVALDVKLRADAGFTILANGALVGETEHGDGTKTAHWRLEQPCPSYLTCFVLGDLTRADDGAVDGVEIAYFGTADRTAEDLHRTFGRTGKMLAWITEKLGASYPFGSKYYQFALPGIGGAMENISLVSWDDIFVANEALAREWGWQIDQVNIHEMAHTWFGDHVVCRDFTHAWLKESWATYIETCWLEHDRGDDEMRYDLWINAAAYFEEADGKYKRPVVARSFNSSWQMFDRHLYPGGAMRLHTLRGELGDEVFWDGVREYLRRFGGKTAETDDFRRVLEERSGRSLGRFFDQWFHAKGYPALEASFRWDAEGDAGVFEIEQSQVGDDPDGPPVFELRLDLGWVVDGELRTRAVQLTERKHVFVIPMERDPDQVRIDPGAKVLLKLAFKAGEERLRRQLRDATDVTGRIQAAWELIGTPTGENLEAVRDAYRAETFWGARVQLAAALGKAGTQVAVDALAALVGEEEHPLVIEPLLRAAGRYRDDGIRTAVEARLDAGLDLPRARAAAFEALGAQRADAPFDRIATAARTRGWNGFAQAGAFRALAGTRRVEAVEVLLEHVAPGTCGNEARRVAVRELGALGRVSERAVRERIEERLVDLLRDRSGWVREAAVAALGTMEARSAIPALEASRGRLATQDRVGVDRVLKGLRASERPAAAALDKELSGLRETVRKLEARVDLLAARLDARGDGAEGENESGSGKGAARDAAETS